MLVLTAYLNVLISVIVYIMYIVHVGLSLRFEVAGYNVINQNMQARWQRGKVPRDTKFFSLTPNYTDHFEDF